MISYFPARQPNDNNLRQLCHFVCDHLGKDITIVEVGSYTGTSSRIFNELFVNVISVDAWEGGYDDTDIASKQNMDEVEAEFDRYTEGTTIIKQKGMSEDISKLYKDNSIDLVYIDADHTYDGVIRDLNLWMPKVKIGGFMSGHDYVEGWGGVLSAINDTIGIPDHTFAENWLTLQENLPIN